MSMKVNPKRFEFSQLEKALLEMLKSSDSSFRLGYEKTIGLVSVNLEGLYSVGVQDDLFGNKEISFILEETFEQVFLFEIDQTSSPKKFWEGAMEASKNFLVLAEMVYGDEEDALAS